MLERLFTSKSRVKILELLLLDPTREFHLRKIARQTCVSPPYVKREIANLMALGLVLKRSQGNLTLFRLNRDSVIAEELKRIFLKTESFGRFMRDSLNEVGNIRFALIYGSFAKGEEAEKSDIDLLVVGDVDERRMMGIIEKVEERTAREVNYIAWTEDEFEKKVKEGIPLLDEIVNTPVIMIVGDFDEFRQAVKNRMISKVASNSK
jgi:predicted nucleotidyltransferase